MTWNTPKIGDRRTRTFFAWLPWGHDHVTYWLQRITVTEEFETEGWGEAWVIKNIS